MTDFATRRRQPFMSESLYAFTRNYQLNGLWMGRKKRRDGRTLEEAELAEVDFVNRFDLWKLDYTAGVPLEDLAPQLSEVVDAFEQWEAVNVEFRKELKRENTDTDFEVALAISACDLDRFDHYQELIQLVAVAVLLRDARSVRRIARALKYSRSYDALLERLIYGYVDDPTDIDGVEHRKPWQTLMDAFYVEGDDASIELINKFCKAWYPAMKGLPWHDAHKRIMEKDGQEIGRYYGYWAFEAGAVAYLLDVDDSNIEHMVYPRDLVAYGRALRARDAWTSPDEPLEKPILVKTGDPAPHSGLYAAFDGLAPEVKLNQGDLLPMAEDLMDPKRPQRAFTWILRQRSDGGPVMT